VVSLWAHTIKAWLFATEAIINPKGVLALQANFITTIESAMPAEYGSLSRMSNLPPRL
jgi:hypothetical protein